MLYGLTGSLTEHVWGYLPIGWFSIRHATFPHGAVQIKNKVTSNVFKVNGHQLKLFHESPQVEQEFVANLSLVLPILCDDVPWVALKELPSPFFYMISLCLHFIACLYWGQCALQVWGEGFRKVKKICFLFFVCCFLYMLLFPISIFV